MAVTAKLRRIKAAYYEPKAGEWIEPRRRGYRLGCCDCGLVHIMDFTVRNGKIAFRVHRAERSTAALRRKPHPFVKRAEK